VAADADPGNPVPVGWTVGDLLMESSLKQGEASTGEIPLEAMTSTTGNVLAIAASTITQQYGYNSEVPELVPYNKEHLGSSVISIATRAPAEVYVVETTTLAASTDVNGVTPTTAHIGTEAALDNSSGWQLDVTGSGGFRITNIDTDRGWFIGTFMNVQTNPTA